MISALQLLWGSTGGKVSAILFAVLFAGGVAFAYSHGHTSGYKDGFTDGQASRNQEVKDLGDKVTALTGIINTERKAQAAKVADVQKTAANAAVETQKKLGKQVRERDAIISDYKAKTSEVIKESCGLSIETVRAINQLIDNANEEAPPAGINAPPATGGSTDSPDTSGRKSVPEPEPPAKQGAINDHRYDLQSPVDDLDQRARSPNSSVSYQGGTYGYVA